MKNMAIFIVAGILVLIAIGLLSVQYSKPTVTTTTVLTTTVSMTCDDDFDCPSKMKCKNSVCVDVGCVNEGESIPSMSINPKNREHMATECCEGLKAIDWPGIFDENCSFVGIVGYPAGVCTKCGDGICKYPETKCNCPEDCT